MISAMHPLLILLVGMAVVMGGILAFRLHAFIALILGALVVAALTSPDMVESYWEKGKTAGGDKSVEWMSQRMRTENAERLSEESFPKFVTRGFGLGAMSLGIVIAMAAIIGKCLLESGAAQRIVMGIRRLFGDKRAPLAFASSSFFVGIPVFFDTVFYLLMPIGKAMAAKTKKNYLLLILCMVAGGTMAHSLVPPTPGPLLVAESLGVNIGTMILGGLIVGSITVAAGYLYASWLNKRMIIPLRPSAFDSTETVEIDEAKLPSLWFSVLPILLPVVLIAGENIVDQLVENVPTWLKVLGDKNVALTLAAIVAIGLVLSRQGRSLRNVSESIQSALGSGGVIILITSAGGAFGYCLKQTGIGHTLGDLTPDSKFWLLPAAFALTSLIRIAQGSATVSMITAIGIVAPLAAAGLPYNPVYLALAIGCGSKPIPWMNDSGFWIISKMSGMTEAETLKSVSVMLTIMGLVGLPVVMLGAWLFPLA
ncbi:MAG: GntP family gluconate:H+ symporter [Verrucomicrobiales bacterium]|jgi:GntP family gluconate:H+ symporter